MKSFNICTQKNAPGNAKELLQHIEERYEFVPTIVSMMANSPLLLEAMITLENLYEKSSLSPLDRNVVLLTASVENKSEVCVAAHSVDLRQNLKADSAIIDALRESKEVPDSRLNTLAEFTREIIRSHGEPISEKSKEEFFKAGFTPQNALDVVLGVISETVVSYANRIVNAPIDEEFQSESWKAPASEKAAA